MTVDGRRYLTSFVLTFALLGVPVSAVINWLLAGLALFGEMATADDYRTMTLGFALASGLLLLGLLPVWALRSPTWVWALTVLLAGSCGVVALGISEMIAEQVPAEYPEPWAAVQVMGWVPTTWPLLVLIVLTPWLRGRSSRSPR